MLTTTDRPPREQDNSRRNAPIAEGAAEWLPCPEHPTLVLSVIRVPDVADLWCVGDGLDFEGHVRGHWVDEAAA